MEKLITQNNILYAKVIRNIDDLSSDVVFSEENDSIQLSLKTYSQNEKTGAHFHNSYNEKTTRTDEIMLVQKGKIRVDFYNEIGAYIKSVYAQKGDVIIAYKGGHNVVIVEEAKILSFNTKQTDNTRIIGANNFELIIDED
ncbi:MAG: hypothetical protein IJD57_04515 [Candidatus Gastranaerophilales bacterium]|nr:hypothetical protein [Candidatus Gastranaerophilales bacterium]